MVVFKLEEVRFALPLAGVERVVPAVEVTPLPNAPSIVLGAINVEGTILPVLSLRRRFHWPDRPLSPADHFLIAQASRRLVVLIVDVVEGVISGMPSAITDPAEIMPGLDQLEGVLKLNGDLILIHDLDKLLSLDEAQALAEVLPQEAPIGH